MRKRILGTSSTSAHEIRSDWLPLDQIASVEVTSEAVSHPVEAALLPDAETGWQAGSPGKQTLRLIFDHPQHLKHIHLVFIEREVERSQEFVLRWSADGGQTVHEIVRQQWNFNPHDSAEEVEDYRVELSGVTQLELILVPDRSGSDVRASLAEFRLA